MTRQNRIKLRSFRQRMYRHPLRMLLSVMQMHNRFKQK